MVLLGSLLHKVAPTSRTVLVLTLKLEKAAICGTQKTLFVKDASAGKGCSGEAI